MAVRQIPDNPRPWWSCRVNGKEYTYKSGATADVPDAVADIIDAINNAAMRPAVRPDPVLPAIGAADEGKVPTAAGGRYVLAGVNNAPLDVNITQTVDNETGKMQIALDKNAAEMYEATAAGKLLRYVMQITVPDGDDEIPAEVTTIAPIIVQKLDAEEIGVSYTVMLHLGSADDGPMFLAAEHLSAEDSVVLKEV